MKYFLPLLLAVLVCSCTARADNGPVYDVTGSLTIPGTTPESITFSFDIGYLPSCSGCNAYDAYVIGGTASFTATGPLTGPITLLGGNGSNEFLNEPSPYVYRDANFLGLFDPAGDEIDLYFSGNHQPTPGIPTVVGTYLYSCTSAACDSALCPSYDVCTAGQRSVALFVNGPVEDGVTAIPEPRTIAMLVAALGALVLFRSRAMMARFVRVRSPLTRSTVL
jgi:hypothetical protein